MTQEVRPAWLQALLAMITVVTCLVVIDQLRIFGSPWLAGIIELETQYYFVLIALLLPVVFLLYSSRMPGPPGWVLSGLDLVLAAAAFIAPLWLAWHAHAILDEGWEFLAPDHAVVASAVLWLLVLEAVRRTSGVMLCSLVLLFSVYPLVADLLPDMVSGMAISFREAAAYHAMSIESIAGLPFRAFATLVIGFLVFGTTLQHTGGGQFFIQLAFALFGGVRGGAAKVAIVSSGLMGSMSGSVITNVMTTGQLTIPAMVRNGFSARTAASVEACASTGGVLLPPIMGSTAFIMASFLDMPYYQVATAAFIPALLYFTALFIQLDAYAARHQLVGLPATELPKLLPVVRDGWFYIGAFALLIVLLLVLQREAMAPWAASLALLVINQMSAKHRLNWAGAVNLLASTGQLLAELLAILCGVGLIIGALSVTGLSGTLVNELLFLAGDDTAVLLLTGALTSFLLGIGLTVTAAYVFLAIVLAPALLGGGLDPLAVHLFILYWGMLSFITPPVALGAFAAASIAGSRPVKTGFEAMRLGLATYLIPFLFVLNPALIGHSSAMAAFQAVVEALFGVYLIACAAQRYLPVVGEIPLLLTIPVGLSGCLVALPGLDIIQLDWSNTQGNTLGLVLILLTWSGSAWAVRDQILKKRKDF